MVKLVSGETVLTVVNLKVLAVVVNLKVLAVVVVKVQATGLQMMYLKIERPRRLHVLNSLCVRLVSLSVR